MEQEFILQIAKEFSLREPQIRAAIQLLDDNNTIPFICRYRKEMTGSLNEIELRQIQKRIQYLRNLRARCQEILESIEKQGKLTPELQEKILAATSLVELEDLYLPYRPKKHTKGQKARAMGLEPLSLRILKQDITSGSPETYYQHYVNPEIGLSDWKEVRNWCSFLVTEMISEIADIREFVRKAMFQQAELHSLKAREGISQSEYEMYYDYQESVGRIPPHRIMAINRGENENILKVKIEIDTLQMLEQIQSKLITHPHSIFTDLLVDCIEDSYKKSIYPAIEREVRNYLSEFAENHAIKLFGTNLKNLLLSPPVRNKVIMGIDPGFRTGCKVAIVNPYGEYLHGSTIYPTPPHEKIQQSEKAVLEMIEKYQVDIIAIGNGTASRETEHFVAATLKKTERNVVYIIVSEAGASVYSASETAQEEFPELEASQRGNISIARRVIDPLSELVKIDPQSIGVGLYQHDIDQKRLAGELEEVVKHCVNYVGVDLNSASQSLLQYVSGINKRLAGTIVKYRQKNGPYTSRHELMKVSGMGDHTFQQCAGFLRIPESKQSLDNTTIHPESYQACQLLFDKFQIPTDNIHEAYSQLKLKLKTHGLDRKKLLEEIKIGEPTLQDILDNLKKPGRDPRDELPPPLFREDVLKIEDLQEGMILSGTVRNVVDFGAFVDIGIKREALLHRSEITCKAQAEITDILSVGDIIQARVIKIDREKNRVALSLKNI